MAEDPKVEAPPADDTTPLPPLKERPSIKQDLLGEEERGRPNERTSAGINFTAAFVLVASGAATLPEIARAWKISFDKLSRRARLENWNGLIRRYGQNFMPKIPPPEQQDPAKLMAKMRAIDDNRTRTIKLAHGLMDQIQNIINKQVPEIPMDSETISELARAVKMLGEISMVAHGDEHAIRSANGNALGGPKNPGSLITINMPSAIASPRKVREIGAGIAKITRELIEDTDEQDERTQEALAEISDEAEPAKPGAVEVTAGIDEEAHAST